MKPKLNWLLGICFLVALAAFAGCDTSGCGGSGDAPEGVDENADYSLPGDYAVCNYSEGLSSSDYSSARITYPCTGSGPFGGTTLVDGISKENSTWMADHLASHGIVVISVTPIFSEVVVEIYERAHKGGIATLRAENGRRAAPIYNKLNTQYLQVLGVDIGGGGALLASADLRSQIRATLVIKPEMATPGQVATIDSSVMCMSGMQDQPANGIAYSQIFDAVPSSNQKAYLVLGWDNIGWDNVDPQGQKGRTIKTHAVYWTKYYYSDGSVFPTPPGGYFYLSYQDGNGSGSSSTGSSSTGSSSSSSSSGNAG